MRYKSVGSRPPLPQRTLDYIERGAVVGHRNEELFAAAQQFRDAGYTREEAEDQLLPRAVADGLGESEARSTLASAYNHAAREAAGFHGGACHSLSRCGTPRQGEVKQSESRGGVPPRPPRFAREPLQPPDPVENGFLRLIDACFRPDEFVGVAPAAEDEDGNVFPKRGVTLTAAEWRRRAQAKGGIDRCFSTKLGLFVRLNPVREGGARNEDVTAFRHALVEFDRDDKGEPIPKDVQFGAIVSSGLPVAALIDSGNKSLHAWIDVSAPDAAEYRRRVDVVWEHFQSCGCPIDPQNRNPSRFSRCPDGWRTVDGEHRRQQLLALNLGASSWAQWEAARDEEKLGGRLLISTLAGYDTANDPNNVLGRRWLCRGGSLVIVGQSGIGKSSLCMQLMILWALGAPAFHIWPTRPLRSLLIQAENDEGDLAEMYQGVKRGMGLTEEDERVLDERVAIYRDTTHTGEAFTALARRLVERHKPDLAWADPLLNYIGDDLSEQKVVAAFCCNRLNAIALDTGVIWCLLHHTGKPSKDPKAASHWTASDLAYSGLGSSALVNWSRETAVLVRVNTAEGERPTFQLSMTKRRKRAGLLTPAGEPTDTIFLRHADGGAICWEQCDPSPEAAGKTPGRYRVGRPGGFDPKHFRSVLEEFGGSVTAQNVDAVADKIGRNVRTVWRWWKRLSEGDL